MKFRKKPIVVEAELFHPDGPKIEGVKRRAVMGDRSQDMVIETPEGTMLVSPGDWIITGVNGEKYPCKPDIFEKTYERVED